MKIGIIGGGVVGTATARAFIDHTGIECVVIEDKIKEKCLPHADHIVYDCDIVFICLPTPQKPDSLECDLSAIHNVMSEISQTEARYLNLVLKSTVPIGTTRALSARYQLPNLVHSPEFLTARVATIDAMMPTRNIIGTCYQEGCTGVLEELYLSRWPHVPVFKMTSDESEAVKLMTNSFYAVKVAFWNEMRCLSNKLDLDWHTLLSGILSGGRVHPSHTEVPGPDGKYGFGGTCLPKDLANMVVHFWQNKVEGGAKVCLAAMERNQVDRKK